jgi:hypothetical protein
MTTRLNAALELRPNISQNAAELYLWLSSTKYTYSLLLLQACIFFRKILFQPGSFVIPWDIRFFHLPHAHFMRKCLLSGHLPLWDPYVYAGRPFYANVQTVCFYVPRWISVVVGTLFRQDSLLYCLEVELVLHVFVGSIFAVHLAEQLGLCRPAAWLTGTVFGYGGYFASQTQHLGAVETAAWLPLVWLATIRAARHRSGLNFVCLVFSLVMSILAGFTPVTFCAFSTALLLALTLAVLRQVSWTSICYLCGSRSYFCTNLRLPVTASHRVGFAERCLLSCGMVGRWWRPTARKSRLADLSELLSPA